MDGLIVNESGWWDTDTGLGIELTLVLKTFENTKNISHSSKVWSAPFMHVAVTFKYLSFCVQGAFV